MCICVHGMCVQLSRRARSSRAGLLVVASHLCRRWESSMCSLEDLKRLLTAEPCLQSKMNFFLLLLSVWGWKTGIFGCQIISLAIVLHPLSPIYCGFEFGRWKRKHENLWQEKTSDI